MRDTSVREVSRLRPPEAPDTVEGPGPEILGSLEVGAPLASDPDEVSGAEGPGRQVEPRAADGAEEGDLVGVTGVPEDSRTSLPLTRAGGFRLRRTTSLAPSRDRLSPFLSPSHQEGRNFRHSDFLDMGLGGRPYSTHPPPGSTILDSPSPGLKSMSIVIW